MFLASCLLIGSMFTVSAGDIPVVLKISGDLELNETCSPCALGIYVNGVGVDSFTGESTIITSLAHGFFVGPLTSEDTGVLDYMNVEVRIQESSSTILTAEVEIPNPNVGAEELIADRIDTGTDLPSETELLKYNDTQGYYWGRINDNFILNNSISLDHMQDNSVGNDELKINSVTQSKIADYAVGTDELANGAVKTDKIDTGAVINAKIRNAAVNYWKLDTNQIANIGDVLTYTATDVMDWQAPGTLTLGVGSVTSSHIFNGTIMNEDIAVGEIGGNLIEDGTIESVDIANGTIESVDIMNDTITSAKIGHNEVTMDDIAGDAINSGRIVDGTITDSDIAPGSLTEDNVAMRDFLKLEPLTTQPFACNESNANKIWLKGGGGPPYNVFQFYVCYYDLVQLQYNWLPIN